MIAAMARDGDELRRRLRARELDFFVAETGTREDEPELDVEPLAPRPVDMVARGELALLLGEPWLFLRYGIVALKGRELNAAARDLRNCVRECEEDLVRDETRLLARRRRSAAPSDCLQAGARACGRALA